MKLPWDREPKPINLASRALPSDWQPAVDQIRQAIKLERDENKNCPFADQLQALLDRSSQRYTRGDQEGALTALTTALRSAGNSNRLIR